MLSDPQSVTINGATSSLPLTSAAATKRSYTSSDGKVRLEVGQFTTKTRFRRDFRLTQTKIAVDPLTAVNQEVSASVIIAIDEPRSGFSDQELGWLVEAVKAAFVAATYNKVLGGEM